MPLLATRFLYDAIFISAIFIVVTTPQHGLYTSSFGKVSELDVGIGSRLLVNIDLYEKIALRDMTRDLYEFREDDPHHARPIPAAQAREIALRRLRERGLSDADIERFDRKAALKRILDDKPPATGAWVPKVPGNLEIWRLYADLSKASKRMSFIRSLPKSAYDYTEAEVFAAEHLNMRAGSGSDWATEAITAKRDARARAFRIVADKLLEEASTLGSRLAANRASVVAGANIDTLNWDLSSEVKVGDIVLHIKRLLKAYIVSMELPACQEIKNYVFSEDHFDRLTDFFISIETTNTLALINYKDFVSDMEAPIIEILDVLAPHALKDPEAAGRYLRCARNLYIAELAGSGEIDINLRSRLKATFKEDEQDAAEDILGAIKATVRSVTARINLCHLYKLVPHPDCSFVDAYKGLEPIRVPSHATKEIRELYRAQRMKDLWIRLNGRGTITLIQAPPESPITIIQAKSHFNKSEAALVPLTAFIGKHFQKPDGLVEPHDLEYRPHDKSSAPREPITKDALKKIRARVAAIRQVPLVEVGVMDMIKYKSVKDVMYYLNDEDKSLAATAENRVHELIDRYIAFENSKGGADQITADDITKYLEDNPDAGHNVLTEPKFGEKHKKITRLFYMAEYEVKVFMSRFEKWERHITAGQVGVSITKNRSERLHDIEALATAPARIREDAKGLYISFDLTEFSKRFPMGLLRDEGELAAELTGDSHYRYIDAVFKTARIVNTSRGEVHDLTGVMGGFEGFLNFTWTAIHGTLLELSLKRLGLPGTAFCYSDDGLLYVTIKRPENVPETEMRARMSSLSLQIVTEIQEFYERAGLHFHIGKTMVSDVIWEYLGTVGYGTKLVPIWIKEASSFGIKERGPGLETIYDNITRLNGQARALASAKCSAPAAAFCLYREVYRFIIRRVNKLRYRDKFVHLGNLGEKFRFSHILMILPAHMGGLRVDDPITLKTVSMVSDVAEFAEDLARLAGYYPETADILASIILASIKIGTPRLISLVSGPVVPSELRDISGALVKRKAVDMILLRKGREVISPVHSKDYINIVKWLEGGDNIDIMILRSLIRSTAPIAEFESTLALATTNTALASLGRVGLKKLQAMDRKVVVEGIVEWWEEVRKTPESAVGGVSRKDSLDYLTAWVAKAYTGIRVRPLKPSLRRVARYAPSSDESLPGINIHYHFDKPRLGDAHDSVEDIDYIEPSNTPAPSDLMPAFMEHVSDKISKRVQRSLCRKAAMFIAGGHNITKLFHRLSTINGYPAVNIPPYLASNASRRGILSTTAPDAQESSPAVFQAVSDEQPTGALQFLATLYDHFDFTTIVIAARAQGSSIVQGIARRGEGHPILRFVIEPKAAERYATPTIREPPDNPPPMTSHLPPDHPNVQTAISRELMDAIQGETDRRNILATSTILSAGISSQTVLSPYQDIAEQAAIQLITEDLQAIMSSRKSRAGNIPTTGILVDNPDPTLVRAAIKHLYLSSIPITFLDRTLDYMVNGNYDNGEFEARTEMLRDFEDTKSKLIEALGSPGLSSRYMVDVVSAFDYETLLTIEEIEPYIKVSYLTPMVSGLIAIGAGIEISARNRLTPSRAHLIRKVLKRLVDREVVKQYRSNNPPNIKTQIDENIVAISMMLDLTRASVHRGLAHFYNSSVADSLCAKLTYVADVIRRKPSEKIIVVFNSPTPDVARPAHVAPHIWERTVSIPLLEFRSLSKSLIWLDTKTIRRAKFGKMEFNRRVMSSVYEMTIKSVVNRTSIIPPSIAAKALYGEKFFKLFTLPPRVTNMKPPHDRDVISASMYGHRVFEAMAGTNTLAYYLSLGTAMVAVEKGTRELVPVVDRHSIRGDMDHLLDPISGYIARHLPLASDGGRVVISCNLACNTSMELVKKFKDRKSLAATVFTVDLANEADIPYLYSVLRAGRSHIIPIKDFSLAVCAVSNPKEFFRTIRSLTGSSTPWALRSWYRDLRASISGPLVEDLGRYMGSVLGFPVPLPEGNQSYDVKYLDNPAHTVIPGSAMLPPVEAVEKATGVTLSNTAENTLFRFFAEHRVTYQATVITAILFSWVQAGKTSVTTVELIRAMDQLNDLCTAGVLYPAEIEVLVGRIRGLSRRAKSWSDHLASRAAIARGGLAINTDGLPGVPVQFVYERAMPISTAPLLPLHITRGSLLTYIRPSRPQEVKIVRGDELYLPAEDMVAIDEPDHELHDLPFDMLDPNDFPEIEAPGEAQDSKMERQDSFTYKEDDFDWEDEVAP